MAGQLAGAPGAGAAADPVAMLERLHDLLTKGVISAAEFEAKKAQLLGQIK